MRVKLVILNLAPSFLYLPPHLLGAGPEGVLEGGDVLETVAGHHPVVVVRGDQEQGGVLKNETGYPYTDVQCTRDQSPGNRRAR